MSSEAQSNSEQSSKSSIEQIKKLNQKIKFLEAKLAKQTEKAQTYRKLHHKVRQTLQITIDSIPQTVFWKDRNSIFVGCDRSFAQSIGFDSTEEIAGSTENDLPWTKHECEWYRRDDIEIMKNRTPRYHVIETKENDRGEQVWLDTTKVPLLDGKGNV